MNDTLRIFLNRQLGLVTMEKTSEEMIHSLSDLNMNRDDFTNKICEKIAQKSAIL